MSASSTTESRTTSSAAQSVDERSTRSALAATRAKGWELVAAIAHRDRAVHTGLGIIGNAAFLAGSVLFLFESAKVVGIWLFIVGAAGMLAGSIGSAFVDWKYDSS